MRCSKTLTFATLILPFVSAPALGDEVADFYRGKTVNFVVSTGVGGGYDNYARPLARHMGRYLPGNPTIVVQNMTGGGGIRAINYLYNVAARDGSVIGMVHSGVPMAPLQGVSAAKFDATKFNWIGSMHKAGTVCLAWHTVPVKTFDDLKTKELLVGSTGPGSGFFINAALLRNLLGAKLKIISGYKSGPHLLNSIEKGEIQGTCGIAMASIVVSHPHWFRNKLVNVLIQTGLERDPRPELANVPMAYEMAKNAEQKAVMSILFANGQMDRPVLAPPELPAARSAALRRALKATLDDAAFKAEMAKARIPIRYVSGEEVEGLIKRLYASPPSVVAAVRKAMSQ